jgi:transcriptional regulator with XRE-family HTH domain
VIDHNLAARRLAGWVDRARTEKGWTLHQLSLQAQVSRPIVSRLINHAAVPGRKSTRDAIGTALVWEPGSCDAILAGGEPVDGAHAFLVTKAAAQRLGARIDQARQDVGLNKNDLARIASVSRPVMSRLINHAEVPGRKAVRDAIGTALGWELGSCDAILACGEPTLRGSALSAKVVAHRLEAIADEAEAAALESARQAERWRQIGDSARGGPAGVAWRCGPGVTRSKWCKQPSLDDGIMATHGSDRAGMPGPPEVAGNLRGGNSTDLVEMR